MSEILDGTKNSVQRMQDFDPDSLPRQDELGQSLSFISAVAPAKKLINLYKQISLSALEDFPDTILQQIHTRSVADFNGSSGFRVGKRHPWVVHWGASVASPLYPLFQTRITFTHTKSRSTVDASFTEEGTEIILTHASACIFTPQDTGYVKSRADSGSTKSIVELLPKAMIKMDG